MADSLFSICSNYGYLSPIFFFFFSEEKYETYGYFVMSNAECLLTPTQTPH